jgi:asparagine synthase (glutamine-hydrolysing)
MSGICAVWRPGNPNRTAETLASVIDGLALAAVEQPARETDGDAGVGASRRFSTQQTYANDRVLVACDADLLNEDELKATVERGKPTPNRQTAALLANLYERFGAEFVERLRGGFGFVLWDRRERKLLAAVDGVGMKRLVYYRDGNVLLIASRIDALMQSGEIERDINPRAIANVLNFCVSLSPETIFNHVHRLQPGTMLLAEDGKISLRRYWDMRYGLGEHSSEAKLSRQLEAVVEQAVRTHCKGRPFHETGAFLSGGTDSSTVVGMMARLGAGPVKTFSIGFQEQPFNELEYAELAAKKFGAEHHTLLVGADDCSDALPHMVRSFDEPFANSSAIPTYFCARLAAENGVRVLLGGDGGDELFGGNAWYASDRVFDLYQAVPAALRKRLIEPVLAAIPLQGGLVRKARSYVRRANMPALERILSYHFLSAHSPATVFEPDFLLPASSCVPPPGSVALRRC